LSITNQLPAHDFSWLVQSHNDLHQPPVTPVLPTAPNPSSSVPKFY